jgi:hypothetical protein
MVSTIVTSVPGPVLPVGRGHPRVWELDPGSERKARVATRRTMLLMVVTVSIVMSVVLNDRPWPSKNVAAIYAPDGGYGMG